MRFEHFVERPPAEVSALVSTQIPEGLGVGVHFDGTRRWYMRTFGTKPEDLYGEHYTSQITGQIRRVTKMIFEDGARAVYLPALGMRMETERGPEYARFQMEGLVRELSREEMREFCRGLDAELSCYGAIERFSDEHRSVLQSLPARTRTSGTCRYLRWGTFAGSPLADVFERVVRRYEATGRAPSDVEAVEDYYGGPHVPLRIWIGQECPSIYGIPLLFNSRTNLYFLQFPTAYLDHRGWRRLLFDALYVRGEQSRLNIENLPDDRRIFGLGMRVAGHWLADRTFA
jgi:hypothetical protein